MPFLFIGSSKLLYETIADYQNELVPVAARSDLREAGMLDLLPLAAAGVVAGLSVLD